MRIPAINYNLSIKIPTFKPLTHPTLSNTMSKDTVEITFKGDGAYLEPAKDIDGIHCPTCGSKMLSQQGYDELLEKAENIKTTQEFVQILKEYKDYVPRNMRNILRGAESPENFAGKDFHEYFVDLARSANYRHRRHINISNSYLLQIADKLPETEKATLQKAITEISPTERSYYYREKLYPLLKSFKTIDENDLYLAISKAFSYVRKSCDYYSVFRIKDANDMSVPDLSKEIIKRLFAFSIVNHKKISNTLPDDWTNNEILICKRCNENSSKKIFLGFNSLDDVEFDNNLRTYLTDLAHLMGEEKLPYNKRYVSNLLNIITKFSKEKITYTEEDINDIIRIFHIASRHDIFEPTTQTKIDVPCAGCSSVMLPHDIKKEIDKALIYCNKPKDYMDLLTRYEKYIGEYAFVTADSMFNIYNKNPDISIEDFYKLILREVKDKLSEEVEIALKKYNSGRPYLIHNGSLQQLQTMQILYKRASDYIARGYFSDFNYKKLTQNCLADIDLDNDCTKSTYIFLEDLKKIAYKYSLTQPNYASGKSDKNMIHTIIFNIFKSDVATADHLDALVLGGANDKNNIVGLCKGCNNLKGRKSINSWFSQILNVRKSFDKHLVVVNQMAKDGIITGYDNWAKNIADKVYKRTHGKFDMRYLFDKEEA